MKDRLQEVERWLVPKRDGDQGTEGAGRERRKVGGKEEEQRRVLLCNKSPRECKHCGLQRCASKNKGEKESVEILRCQETQCILSTLHSFQELEKLMSLQEESKHSICTDALESLVEGGTTRKCQVSGYSS